MKVRVKGRTHSLVAKMLTLFQSLDSRSTDRAASATKCNQDQSESETHLGAQVQPHLQVHDALHIGARYAADYLGGNYVNGG